MHAAWFFGVLCPDFQYLCGTPLAFWIWWSESRSMSHLLTAKQTTPRILSLLHSSGRAPNFPRNCCSLSIAGPREPEIVNSTGNFRLASASKGAGFSPPRISSRMLSVSVKMGTTLGRAVLMPNRYWMDGWRLGVLDLAAPEGPSRLLLRP